MSFVTFWIFSLAESAPIPFKKLHETTPLMFDLVDSFRFSQTVFRESPSIKLRASTAKAR